MRKTPAGLPGLSPPVPRAAVLLPRHSPRRNPFSWGPIQTPLPSPTASRPPTDRSAGASLTQPRHLDREVVVRAPSPPGLLGRADTADASAGVDPQ
jgi:hypothetical protein